MQTVFYCWQSDLSSGTNRNIIESSIKEAIRKVNQEIDIEGDRYSFDKDTRNETGSPDIVETILKKIKECSFFVSDITPICETQSGKLLPNPNVLFESGYFIGIKGFEKAILVLNTAYALVENLPFDLKTKRITTYHLKEEDLSDTENKKRVIARLSSVIYSNLSSPKQFPPIDLIEIKMETEKVKRERDLSKLKR